ncbi:hypothetical protein NCS52_00347000 [Fusarium sp. LHS14.1]|nr:hypothetical protein NCS52_00347000 [Fusarium sp. LHS14.1]
MRFGLVANKHLDSANYIHLSQSTITSDTVTTNFGMMNYDSGAWDGIRRLLTFIPQQHAYWKVDRGLGSGPWARVQDESIIPIPPAPEFEMEPLPIESWLQSGDTVSESTDLLKCPACHSNFGSIALLVQHNRRAYVLTTPSPRQMRFSVEPSSPSSPPGSTLIRSCFTKRNSLWGWVMNGTLQANLPALVLDGTICT